MKAPASAVASKDHSVSPPPTNDPDVLAAPYVSLLNQLENKQKYLETRYDKLQKFDDEAKSGKALPDDKEKARLCLPDVKNQLGFIQTFQKKVLEKQREYNKKNKQRNHASRQENDQLRTKITVDLLTARYILGQYQSSDGQSRIANSFTSDERDRLDLIACFFNPEITDPKTIKQTFSKNTAVLNAILQQNQNFSLDNGYSAADAGHLLETLLSVVENTDEPVSTPTTPVDSIPEEPTSDPTHSPVVEEPAAPAPTPETSDKTITFGYFNEENTKQESAPVAAVPLEPMVTESSENNDSATDSEKPPIEEVKRADGKHDQKGRRPRFNKNRVPRKPEHGENGQTSDSTEKENKVREPRVKTERPVRPSRDGKPVNAAPRSNGPARGGNNNNGQRRFNKEAENGQNSHHDQNGQRSAPRNVYNKNYHGNNQKNGYNGYSRNGYSRGHEHDKAPAGYIREGNYYRPPPGTCGFTLQVKQ